MAEEAEGSYKLAEKCVRKCVSKSATTQLRERRQSSERANEESTRLGTIGEQANEGSTRHGMIQNEKKQTIEQQTRKSGIVTWELMTWSHVPTMIDRNVAGVQPHSPYNLADALL